MSDMASIRPSAPVMEGASSPSSPCRVGPQSTRPSDHADCTTLRAEVDVERHDPSYSAPPSSPDGSHQSGLTDGKDLGYLSQGPLEDIAEGEEDIEEQAEAEAQVRPCLSAASRHASSADRL